MASNKAEVTDKTEVTALVADVETVFEKAARLRLPTVAYLLELTLLEVCRVAYGEDLVPPGIAQPPAPRKRRPAA